MIRVLSVALCLLAVREHAADAIAACSNGEGWSLRSGATVPVHPKLVYFADGRMSLSTHPPTIKATIGGKSVPTKLSFVGAIPYELVIVEVDSDKTGALKLTWQEPSSAPNWRAQVPTASYKVARIDLPKEAKGTVARFHQAYHHTSVHELEDGLGVTVDVPATRFTAKWRTDGQKPWNTLELTAVWDGKQQVARLGSLGCSANFGVFLLERGIDLELTAVLADGSAIPVKGVPTHVVLAPLPKDAPTSTP